LHFRDVRFVVSRYPRELGLAIDGMREARAEIPGGTRRISQEALKLHGRLLRKVVTSGVGLVVFAIRRDVNGVMPKYSRAAGFSDPDLLAFVKA
jgi:hypothetical protein